MSAKLHKIDELSKLLDDKNELAGNLLDLYHHFNLSQAMVSCKITKFTGVSCSLLMLFSHSFTPDVNIQVPALSPPLL